MSADPDERFNETCPPIPENEYGCVRCQAYHRESDGPVYAEHIPWQSKHGIRRAALPRIGTSAPQPASAALERVRVLAGRWAAIEGGSLDAEVDRRVGSHLLAVVCEDSSAEFRLAEVTRLAESWLTPGLPTLFYPAAGQCVLDAIKGRAGESPVTVTKGDTVRIIPEHGPERVMTVSHVEHHIITLTDPEASDGN